MQATIGFLFPGQGSQSVGMGKALYESNAEIPALYQLAEKVLGYDVGALCFEGPAEQLNQTEYTQPALLVTSLAALHLVQGGPLTPAAVAGHSLGEYTALVAAGAIGFSEAVGLVQKRAQYMTEAVSPGSGLVAAVLGLSGSEVSEVCQEAQVLGIVAPANLNSPGQTVIAGEKVAVEQALELAKLRGARVKALPVSVPVHTPLMQVAADRLKKDIDSLVWSDLKVPLINNVEAKALRSADEVRVSLVRQLPSSVRWQETIQTMWDMGITHFIEIGPGKVLTGLVKRIVPEAQFWNITDQESYEHVLAHVA
ncbi:MAG: ACP S-malonyltransferase [Nitrospirota bacterium]|nr:ACP S-malonyltransferase [Nitrospirota bacterium]MDH5775470.1 ACP S-malonyltransferase [Nitrospirota bacterium]